MFDRQSVPCVIAALAKSRRRFCARSGNVAVDTTPRFTCARSLNADRSGVSNFFAFPARTCGAGNRQSIGTEDIAMQQLKDVMSRDVKMVTPETTIREAAQQMRDGDFGMLPVAENDRMVGAISDRDIAVRAVADDKGPETPVRDVMSPGICWAYEEDSVERAAQLMSERQVRRLPIVNKAKRLVGIVSLGDFAVETEEIEPAAEALSGISQH
jgi:CBS domain-containing protein